MRRSAKSGWCFARCSAPEKFNLDELAKASEGFSGAEIEEAVISGLFEVPRDR